MRKLFKIFIVVFAMMLIIFAEFGAQFVLDRHLPNGMAQIQQSLPPCPDSTLSNAACVEIGESEDRDARAQDLVNN